MKAPRMPDSCRVLSTVSADGRVDQIAGSSRLLPEPKQLPCTMREHLLRAADTPGGRHRSCRR